MAYVLDIAVILIMVLCIWHGWRRGLIRTAVMLVGFAAAAFLAGQIATPAAAWLYTTVVSPHVEQTVVEYVQSVDGPVITLGPEILFGENSALGAYFADLGWNTTVNLSLSDLSEEVVREAVRPLIAQVLEPILLYLLKAVAAFAAFLLLLAAVFLLARLMEKVFELPVLKQVNTVGGITLGVLQGVFWVFLFLGVLQFAVGCGLFGSVITTETLDGTYVVSVLIKCLGYWQVF